MLFEFPIGRKEIPFPLCDMLLLGVQMFSVV